MELGEFFVLFLHFSFIEDDDKMLRVRKLGVYLPTHCLLSNIMLCSLTVFVP